jgi:hypothetical protein
MSPTEHPQTTKLAALEQEKETFRQEALNYKAKVLQQEKEKDNWLQGQVAISDMVVIVLDNVEGGSRTDGLVQAMFQVSLQIGEIKNLKENLENLKQEMKIKDEKMAPLAVDTERGVNQYQVQFKNLFQLILKPFNYIQ